MALYVLLLSIVAQAATTDRYVSALASSGDGTSGNPWTLSQAFASAVAGDIVHIKQDGTYARTTTTDSITTSGTLAQPIVFRGYKTTINDAFLGRNSDGTLNVNNMPVITYTSGRLDPGASKSYLVFECLNISADARSGALVNINTTGSVGNIISNCRIANTQSNASAAAVALAGQSGHRVVDCDLSATGLTVANAISGSNTYTVMGCRITCTNGPAIVSTNSNNNATVIGNVIYDSTIGVSLGGSSTNLSTIAYNTFDRCSTAAVQTSNNNLSYHALVAHNAITNCGYAVQSLYNATGQTAMYQYGNRYRDNTNADQGFDDWARRRAVTTDTGGDETDYTNASTKNFLPIYTSPLKGAGAFNGGDIGALHRPENLPAVADVEQGVQYGGFGTEFTGTLVATGGGTYPAITDVRNGTQYGPNGTDYTGTYLAVAADMADIVAALLDATTAGHTTANTVGAAIAAINSGTLNSDGATVAEVQGLLDAFEADNFPASGVSANVVGVTGTAVTSIADFNDYTTLATVGTMADAMWDEAISAHLTAGTTGATLNSATTGGVDIATLVDAVWDEAISGHLTSGTTGAKLNTASSGSVDLAALVDQIWDELLSGHVVPGSAGAALTTAQSAGNAPSAETIATTVLDSALSAHTTTGTVGAALGDIKNMSDKMETMLEPYTDVYRYTLDALRISIDGSTKRIGILRVP